MTVIDWDLVKARLGAAGADDDGVRRRILAQRARRLAVRRPVEAEAATVAATLLFTVGEERYALPMAAMREVVRSRRCTPVPGSAADLLGVVNVHGEIVPVLDPAVILGVRRDAAGSGHLVVLRIEGARAALQVDRLQEVRRIDLARLNPPADGMNEDVAASTLGVTEDLVAVLDVAAFLAKTSLYATAGAGLKRGGDQR